MSLVPAILGQFETMFGNTTEWMMMEHIVNVIDVFVVNMRDRFDDMAGSEILPANKAPVHVWQERSYLGTVVMIFSLSKTW